MPLIAIKMAEDFVEGWRGKVEHLRGVQLLVDSFFRNLIRAGTLVLP